MLKRLWSATLRRGRDVARSLRLIHPSRVPGSPSGPAARTIGSPPGPAYDSTPFDSKRNVWQHPSSPAEVAELDRCGGQSARLIPVEPAAAQQARDLASRAMKATSPEASARLASLALALDPACVPAFVQMAWLSCGTHGDLVEQIRIGLSIAERALAERAHCEKKEGRLWGLSEARPYMETRAYLARLLVEDGKIDEAIRHYEELLRFDIDDNLCLRYPLLACYLTRNDLKSVRGLFRRFNNTEDAVFAWAAVLEKVVNEDFEGVTRTLNTARRLNGHVEPYLTRQTPVPRNCSAHSGSDKEREAIFCAVILGPAWRKRRKAVAWLKRIR